MADPLSVTASIIAVLQLSSSVVEYVNKVRDGGSERTQLLDETQSLKTVLRKLQDLIEEPSTVANWKASIQDLNNRGGPLEICKLSLKRLLKVLNAHEGASEPSAIKSRLGDIALALKWPFKSGEVAATVQVLERQKTYFLIAVQMDVYKLTKTLVEDGDENRAIFQAMASKVGDVGGGIKEVLQQLRDKSEIEILRWLSNLQPEQKHREVSSRRLKGTGQWFLDEPLFKAWFEAFHPSDAPVGHDQTPNALYCYGIQGAGKTVISSLVIDHISGKHANSDVALAYIYCDYKEQTGNVVGQTVIGMVGSIIKHLLAARLELPQHLVDLHKKEMTGSGAVQLPDLQKVVLSLCNERQTFIIIDALDECDFKTYRKDFLKFLTSLRAASRAQILFTSRPDQKDIEKSMKGLPRINIRASASDTRMYLEHKIKERLEEEDDEELDELFDKDLRKDIVDQLVENSEGMFLLPDLQIRTVLEKMNQADIREALRTLPSTLYTEFENTLRRISNQASERSKLAMRILMWVSSVLQPLTVSELRHALVVENGDKALKPDKMTPTGILRSSILDFCQGLILIEKDTDTVRLVHYSLQEYLYGASDTFFPNKWQKLAECCLTYLLFDAFDAGVLPDDDSYTKSEETYPFYGVAAVSWGVYITGLGPRPTDDWSCEIMKLAKLLLTSSNKLERCSQAEFVKLRPDRYGDDFSQGYSHGLNAVHICALYCLWPLMEDFLAEGFDPNVRVGYGWHSGWSPLHFVEVALTRDEDENVRMLDLLIERGADVSIKGNEHGWTVLHRAAFSGNVEFVRKLIHSKIEIDVRDKYGCTPLLVAIDASHVDCAMLLLDSGADVEMKEQDGDTPLCLACRSAELVSVARMLLQKGADPNALGYRGLSPFHSAAVAGNEDILNLLLEHKALIDNHSNMRRITPAMVALEYGPQFDWFVKNGANPNAHDSENFGLLCFAAELGRDDAVSLLLKHGADLNAHNCDDGITALQGAVTNGHYSTVKLLLEEKANIEATTDDGEVALHLASEWPLITKLLLDYGAALSTSCKTGSILHHVVQFSSVESDETLKILIEHGADIRASDFRKRTPLHIAVFRHDSTKVEILLEAGADIEAKDHENCTPVLIAMKYAPEFVSVLIEHGASLQAPATEVGITALHIAASAPHQNVNLINLLLKHGFDGNERDVDGLTPLTYAAVEGHREVLRTLLMHPATRINATDDYGRTTLEMAADFGPRSCIDSLLDFGGAIVNRPPATLYESRILHTRHTTLMLAVQYGSELNVADALLSGADTEAEDKHGRTALLLAAQSGRLEIVDLLLRCGANIEHVCADGNTILHYVARSANAALVRYVVERMPLVDFQGKYGKTPLAEAIFKDNDDLAYLLIDRGAATTVRTHGGSNLLHLAAIRDNVGLAQTLLRCGVRLDEKNSKGQTPLLKALVNGSRRVAALLIDHGADVSVISNAGISSLFAAVQSCPDAIVEMVCNHNIGALVNHPTGLDNATPLHAASRRGNAFAVKRLLHLGADVHAINKKGCTPIHDAAAGGDIDVLQLLIESGANISQSSNQHGTPLLVALQSGLVEVAYYLISAGADINAETPDTGLTPLHVAAKNGDYSMVSFLISRGAFVDALDNLHRTPAFYAATLKDFDSLGFLIYKGTNLSIIDAQGGTLLTAAAHFNRVATVKYLIQAGVDINPHLRPISQEKLPPERICTPTEVAVANNHQELVHTLVELGADLKDVTRGNECLRSAAINGNAELLRFLIANGAPVNNLDGYSNALFDALFNGHQEAVLCLQEHGASLEQVSANGRTALHVASMSGNEGLVNFLLDRGLDRDIKDINGMVFSEMPNLNTDSTPTRS